MELARSNHLSSGRLTRDHVLKICDLRNDDEEVFMLPSLHMWKKKVLPSTRTGHRKLKRVLADGSQ